MSAGDERIDATTTAAFRVVRRWTEMVPRVRTEVLAATDDPVEAHVIADEWRRSHPGERYDLPSIEGEHPTHSWNNERRCDRCGSPMGGCFKSQMPCGWEPSGAFIEEMNRWREAHR